MGLLRATIAVDNGSTVAGWVDTLVNGYTPLPPDDVAALLDLCRAALAGIAPDLGTRGVRLLAAHPPEQWPVEWRLPGWLAASFGLDDDAGRALTVCNLLGLGFVRVQDDLAEAGGGSSVAAEDAVLAAACYEAALSQLAGMFGSTPLFWQHRRAIMAQWLRSLLHEDAGAGAPFRQWQEHDLLRLAWRGAPLKISAVGACLLADRAPAIPPLLDALDHLLTAQVLLDHIDDWREDLAGRRYNAFVAYASDLPQDAAHAEANSRQVLTLLMQGDPGGYFDLIQRHATRSAVLSAEAGCAGLADFAQGLAIEADAGCQQLVAAARHDLTMAVRRVLAS